MAANPLESLFGNETFRSIAVWGVAMQLIQPILAPIVQAIQNETLNKLPDRPLSVADAVDAALRNHLSVTDAKQAAAESGVPGQDFDTLLSNAGEPPALEMLLEAFRRGVIAGEGIDATVPSLVQGIRESRLNNKWIETILKLQWRLPDPGVVIEGWLRAQTTPEQAKAWLTQNGIPDDVQQLMLNAAGRPPSPGELSDMWHRGIIGEKGTGAAALTLEQGFYETDLKNKWLDPWIALQAYLPPPRTVTAMVREGALQDQEALDLFKKAGLDATLAGQYLAAAHAQKIAADKELTKSEILTMYENALMTAAQTTALLGSLGYNGDVAAALLAYADFHVLNTKIASAVNKLQALFVARKIDAQGVTNALGELGAPRERAGELLAIWTIERESQVKTLTAAQWADAVYYSLIDFDTGVNEIVGLGYPAFDAWALVALRLHGGGKAATVPPPPPATASGA